MVNENGEEVENSLPPIDSIDVHIRDTFNPIRRVKRDMEDNHYTEVQPDHMWLLQSALHHAVDAAGLLSEYIKADEEATGIGVKVPTGRGYRIVKESWIDPNKEG